MSLLTPRIGFSASKNSSHQSNQGVLFVRQSRPCPLENSRRQYSIAASKARDFWPGVRASWNVWRYVVRKRVEPRKSFRSCAACCFCFSTVCALHDNYSQERNKFCGDFGECKPCGAPSINKSFSLDFAHGRRRDLRENGEYYNFIELDTDSLEISYRTFNTDRVGVISGFLVRLGVSSGLLKRSWSKSSKGDDFTHLHTDRKVYSALRSSQPPRSVVVSSGKIYQRTCISSLLTENNIALRYPTGPPVS